MPTNTTALTRTEIKNTVLQALTALGSTVSIPISYNSRLTRAIGRAKLEWSPLDGLINPAIEFSTKLIPLLTRDQLIETIRHEVAHIVAVERYGRQAIGTMAHGYRWKSVMRELGYSNPTAVLELPAANSVRRKLTRYVVVCGCAKGWLVTRGKADKAHGQKCIACKETLTKTGETKKI